MTSSFSATATASQRALPVVALVCEADLRLCRAMVQALAEKAPAYIYRINPKPHPPEALDLRLALSTSGAAQLVWPGGAGEPVSRNGQADPAFARHIVEASPALDAVLKGSR